MGKHGTGVSFAADDPRALLETLKGGSADVVTYQSRRPSWLT